MLNKIKAAFDLLDRQSRRQVIIYALTRALLGALDLIGIFLMGILLAKTTSFLTSGNSETTSIGSIDISILNTLSISELAFFALGAFILKSISSTIFMKLMVNSLAKAEAKIATSLFNKSLFESKEPLTQRPKSDSVFSLTYSTGYGITDLLAVSVTIFSETILLIAISVAFAIIDIQITLIIALYFAAIGLIIQTVVGRKFQKAGSDYAEAAVESSLIIENTVDAFREIKTLGKERFFVEKFMAPRKKMADATATVQFLYALPRYIVESALIIGAIGLAAVSARSGNPTQAAQTLGIFLTGGLRIMASMLPLQNALGASKQLAARAQKLFDLAEILKFDSINDERFVVIQDADATKSTAPVGLNLDHVSFKYPGSANHALVDISLEIKPGQLVALIGPSGSGKSTLADLIIGITKSDTGEIYYELNSNKFTETSNFQCGYVPQKPGLVAGSIKENIALGITDSQIDLVSLERSIKQAHLGNLIQELKDGVETSLGAQSNSLSGGQLQRIGLARALYVQPNLLVLDEATSALDADSEAAVSDSLNELRGLCTVIVIAHRLATVQNADVVFVIEQGKITAKGKFNELVKSNELVARYVELSEIN
jgi:ATP-binding cassette subfamily C protein